MPDFVIARQSGENFALSPDGAYIYVAGNDGHLRVYVAATGNLLQDFPIGANLEAITISRDGRYAIITEGVPISTSQSNDWTSNVSRVAVYRVDLRTGYSDIFAYTARGSDYTFADVAYTGDQTVVLSQNILPGWSGWAPLVTLDLTTGIFTQHSSYYAGLGSAASLNQSVTPGNVLLGQLGLSSAEYFVIDPQGNSIDTNGTYTNGVQGYANGVEAFVGSGASGFISLVSGGGFYLYNGNFDFIGNLASFFPHLASSPGITFSADGTVLYAIDPIADAIVGISTQDFFLAETIPLGNYDYSVLQLGNELTLAPDGLSFLVATTTGILHIDRPLTNIRTEGNDTITGTAQNDELSGGGGNDLLIGLAGNDLLVGGTGKDTLVGGLGDDDYLVDTVNDVVVEEAGQGIDWVYSTSDFYLYANLEALTLQAGSGAHFGVGNGLDNQLYGNEFANLLIGMDGADTVYGGDGADQLFGGEGNDRLFGEAGIDYIVGGNGADNVDGGNGADSIYGEDGNDILGGGASFDTDIIVGGSGDDTIYGDSGMGDYDLLYGNLGNDAFYVDTPADLVFEQAGEGVDTVYANISRAGYYLHPNVENLILTGQTPFGVGNALDNALTGNAFTNWLLGGGGNDTINGKGGNDVLFGEAGADTFVFEAISGQDVIGDFTHGQDTIRLIGSYANFAALSGHFVQNGADCALDLGGGHMIVMLGVQFSTLTAGDFLFA